MAETWFLQSMEAVQEMHKNDWQYESKTKRKSDNVIHYSQPHQGEIRNKYTKISNKKDKQTNRHASPDGNGAERMR